MKSKLAYLNKWYVLKLNWDVQRCDKGCATKLNLNEVVFFVWSLTLLDSTSENKRNIVQKNGKRRFAYIAFSRDWFSSQEGISSKFGNSRKNWFWWLKFGIKCKLFLCCAIDACSRLIIHIRLCLLINPMSQSNVQMVGSICPHCVCQMVRIISPKIRSFSICPAWKTRGKLSTAYHAM